MKKLCNMETRLRESTEQLEPFIYWDRGIMQVCLAEVKCELADLAKDSETKKSMLQEAILEREDALKLMRQRCQLPARKEE